MFPKGTLHWKKPFAFANGFFLAGALGLEPRARGFGVVCRACRTVPPHIMVFLIICWKSAPLGWFWPFSNILTSHFAKSNTNQSEKFIRNLLESLRLKECHVKAAYRAYAPYAAYCLARISVSSMHGIKVSTNWKNIAQGGASLRSVPFADTENLTIRIDKPPNIRIIIATLQIVPTSFSK